MFRSISAIQNNFLVLMFGLVLLIVSAHYAQATLPTLSQRVIADSEEPFSRRIYSYDMKVDDQGDIHIVYSKHPTATTTKESVYYVRRINGTWMPEILITADGFTDNKCTFLEIRNDGSIHICYTKDDGSGPSMYFRTVVNGVLGTEKYVYPGGWWGRMQVGDDGNPLFVAGGNKYPDKTSRLILYTTSDGMTWEPNYLNLPYVKKFQICDFIYKNGVYHITYGDAEYQKLVWSDKYMTQKTMDTFHNLHYVTSTDGVAWEHHLIDDSQTLRNAEFWTKMELDQGRPIIAMYKYKEYENVFNSGTSALLYSWNGVEWTSKTITNTIYPDTNEGMGVGLAINGPGDYFGAWDFSPRYPQIIPGSPRGNTAMRRSGSNGDWSNVVQLDPFSLEGRAKFQAFDGKLYFIALGDYTDTKLYFREFSIPTLDTILPPEEDDPHTPIQVNGLQIYPAVNLLLKK